MCRSNFQLVFTLHWGGVAVFRENVRACCPCWWLTLCHLVSLWTAGGRAERQGSPGVRQTSESCWSPSGQRRPFTSQPYDGHAGLHKAPSWLWSLSHDLLIPSQCHAVVNLGEGLIGMIKKRPRKWGEAVGSQFCSGEEVQSKFYTETVKDKRWRLAVDWAAQVYLCHV